MGPLESRPFQVLLPQTKTGALPAQDLGLVTPAIVEYKQLLGKRVMFQCVFDQHCQPVDAFAKVDNVSAQIHGRQIVRGLHYPRVAAVFNIVDKAPASVCTTRC